MLNVGGVSVRVSVDEDAVNRLLNREAQRIMAQVRGLVPAQARRTRTQRAWGGQVIDGEVIDSRVISGEISGP
jgi:hypothetical protein